MYKIALFTPLHPQKTGIADYIEEMLPYLRNELGGEYRIDIFVDNCKPNNEDVINNHKIFEIDAYESIHDDYDLAVYQIGNSPYHIKIYQLALKYPGIVVLHDYAIHNLAERLYLAQMQSNTAYLEELEFNHGVEAKNLAAQRFAKGEPGLWATAPIEYPMNRRIVDSSLGAIVFSQFAKEHLEAYGCNVPVHRVYLHCGGECEKCSDKERDAARKRLKITTESGETVIGVFGFIGGAKRPYSILEAVHTLLGEGKKIKLIYIGQVMDDCKDLPKRIEQMGISSQVRLTGFTTNEEFNDYLLASDICISLRYPTMGETSGVLMRALSKGKPSIVTNVGTFMELSDDMVIKINHGESETDELIHSIGKLIEDKHFRNKIGANSLQYAKEHLEIASTAQSFAEFIKEAVEYSRIKDDAMYQAVKNKISSIYRELNHIEPILLDHATDILSELFGGTK